MNCRDIQERFSAYLDGELPTAQEAAVARHLEDCESCRREFQVWQQLWAMLDEPVKAPADLQARVLARLAPRRSPWWQQLALAASLLVGIFVGGSLGLEVHHTLLMLQSQDAQEAWEEFAPEPAHSLSGLLAGHDLENGNGS